MTSLAVYPNSTMEPVQPYLVRGVALSVPMLER